MSGAMSQHFVRYIVENIDDNAARLVYADWLDENGQTERAEFIRVQVERARLPAWDAAQVRLRLREAKLLKRYGETWLAELPTIEGAKWEGFRRGIVAEVSFASFEAMRTHAHACRAVAPIEAITVRWPRQREANDASVPVAELRELSLTGRPNDLDEIAWLADSPQLATLHTLTARGLWSEGLARLVTSPHLARLRALRLPSNDLGNAGLLALIGAASLTTLETLDLSGRCVSEVYGDDPDGSSPGMEALAGWRGLATVRSLTLASNEIGQASLRTLLRSRNAGALKALDLRSSQLDGEALAEFLDAAPGLQLETLDLGENFLRRVGISNLVSAPCLRELKMLWLDRCEIPQKAIRLLIAAAFIDRLRFLNISHNHFGPAGLNALLERNPPALHTLRIRDNDLFDRGATLLADSPASNMLLELDLSQNGLGPTATAALGTTAHLKELLVLRLNDNLINESAAATLLDSPLGQRLAVLELDSPPDLPPADADDAPF